MSSLADFAELRGFFSYSREDDEDSNGGLSALRDRIQRELRSQLGRSTKSFGLWQDKEAIAPGSQWETEIRNAVAKSVFFIPIITPTVIRSQYCRFELESFLARQAALGRNDLVFPILYINVAALSDDELRQSDPVLSIIGERQYEDWRQLRHWDVNSREIKEAIERFCRGVTTALQRPWLSPEERKKQDEAASLRLAEAERKRQEEAASLQLAEVERKRQEDAASLRLAEAERKRQEAEAGRQQAAERAEADRRRRDTETVSSQTDHFIGNPETAIRKEPPSRAYIGILVIAALLIALAGLAVTSQRGSNEQIASPVPTPEPDPQPSTPLSYSGKTTASGRPVLKFD